MNDIITRSKENIPEDQIRIFPNPARNKFSIQVGVELKNASLEIFNVIGEKVYSQKIDSKKEIINCADLPNGIYLVTIENQGKSSIQKLVIQ